MALEHKKERWKPIFGFEAYAVSSLGRIKRVVKCHGVKKGHILRSCPDKDGYLLVGLSHSGKVYTKKIHRLVCAAFHGDAPSSKHNVAHENGIRSDNRSSNLRWATQSENLADRLRHGTDQRGSKNSSAKLDEIFIPAIRLLAKFRTHQQIADIFKISRVNVTNIINRKRWAHIGDTQSISNS